MIPITPGQLKALHTTLQRKGILDQKESLVRQYSNNRTGSSRELTMLEARELLEAIAPVQRSLTPQQEAQAKGVQVMRGKLKGLAWQMGWTVDQLDAWCIKYGSLHKGLYAHTYQELPTLVSQFEFGPYKHFLTKKS